MKSRKMIHSLIRMESSESGKECLVVKVGHLDSAGCCHICNKRVSPRGGHEDPAIEGMCKWPETAKELLLDTKASYNWISNSKI
jgi:hypothetical protein